MPYNFDLEELLSGPNVAILATVDGKARPHGVPIWYVYEGGVFLISADRESQKVRNIMRTGNAALIIDRRETPYHSAMVRGRAEIGPAPSDEFRLRLAIRYLGEERGRAYQSQGSSDSGVTITLHPDEVIEYQGATS